MTIRRGCSHFVLIAAVLACTEPRSAGPDNELVEDRRVTREDSAGVELVSTAGPLWEQDEAWTLAASPALAVPDTVLGLRRIVGVTRLADGTVAVGDAALGGVLLLDSSGMVTRRIEGRVAGRPLRQLFWLASAGDTVVAYDIAEHRLVRIPPEGNPTAIALRTVAQSSFTALRPLGLFAGGGILAASGGSSFPFPGDEYQVVQDSAVLLRYGPTGRVRDTLAVVPWSESFGVATGGERRRMLVPLPRPYGRATSAAAAGELLYVGLAERYEIAVHDTTGDLVRLVRIPAVRDSLPAAAVDSYRARVQRRVERGDSGLAERALAGALEKAPYPATVPAYERVMVAPDGTMWVLDAAAVTRESVTWRVFDPAGRWLGVVPMPSRFLVYEIGADYVLGVWTDDAGGREVRMYRVEKPEPPPA